jgi:hypothetical protein
MSQEIQLTEKHSKTIFHPLLLNIYPIKNDSYAIVPNLILNNTNTIEDYKYTSNSNITNNIVNNFEKIFNSNEYFLMCSLNITNIDDVFPLLDNLIGAKNKNETIDFIMNLIMSVFYNKIDDIHTDKFVEFYIKYLQKYYKTNVEYKNIFKIIRVNLSNLVNNNLIDDKKQNMINEIHSNIINNILLK